MMLAGFLFTATTVSAQEVVKKSGNKEVAAQCAKVCAKKVAEAKVSNCQPAEAKTPTCQSAKASVVRTVNQTDQVAEAPSTVSTAKCDPADCPPLCKLLCPRICSQGTHLNRSVATCNSIKPVVPAKLHASAEPVKEQ